MSEEAAQETDVQEEQSAEVEAPAQEADTAKSDEELTKLRRDLEKARREAANYRTKLRDLEPVAAKSKSVEEQLSELRSQMAQRDAADLERSSKLALSQVHTRLAEAGIKRDDVAGLLELVDPITLLSDGQPSDEAIDKLAVSLTRIAGRAAPDPDQGRKGGEAPPDINALIRQAAGVRRIT